MQDKNGRTLFGDIKNKKIKILISVIFAVIVIITVISEYHDFDLSRRASDGAEGLFSVHFIDVGQGDSALLKSPDGRFMLIDCGPVESSAYLVKYLMDVGVEKLDYLLISHPHSDHYGSCTQIMKKFDVDAIILHEDFAYDYPYDKYIRNAKKNGTEVILTKVGDSFVFDGCADFEIIGPEYTDADDLNESSLCFRVVYEDTAFMFTGDAEQRTESYMLSGGKPLKADVLKAGHHGSSTSNSREFVTAVNPEWAVVSCAEKNDYGHPHREVVALFNELDIEMLKTHRDGNIVFVSDGKKVSLSKSLEG